MCARNDDVKIKCTTRYLDQKSLDRIMHGGSSKRIKKRQKYQLNEFLEPFIPPGDVVTLVVPHERRRVRGTWVH